MTTTTSPTTDLRGRRDQLGATRLQVAIQARVSLAHLASLEGGLRPCGGSEALARVLQALDELEAAKPAERFVKFQDVADHLEGRATGTTATSFRGDRVFERSFPNLAAVSAQFIASGATSLLAASNAARFDLKLQGADAFWLGVASGVPSGAAGMPGLLIASGQLSPAITHNGPVYGFSGAANGATVAIRIWEASC
jgi:hypothetical protein